MPIPGRRRSNPVLQPVSDGHFELMLDRDVRSSLIGLLDELAQVIAEPNDPRQRRLAPPAYPDDPDREAEYQLLAGDELRTSRLEAVSVSREALESDRLTDEQVWAWLRSLNAVRLIVGVELGIEDDDDDPYQLLIDDTVDDSDEDASRQLTLARVYAFVTEVQNWALVALRDG